MLVEIRDYIPEKDGDWIHQNDLIVFPNSNLIRYDRSVYDTFQGWLIYVNSYPVGSCLYGVDDDTGIRPYWFFAYLSIIPEYQNKGLGSKLLKRLLETADANRANLECFTEHNNYVALHMYKKNGFVITETGNHICLKRRPVAKLRKIEY